MKKAPKGKAKSVKSVKKPSKVKAMAKKIMAKASRIVKVKGKAVPAKASPKASISASVNPSGKTSAKSTAKPSKSPAGAKTGLTTRAAIGAAKTSPAKGDKSAPISPIAKAGKGAKGASSPDAVIQTKGKEKTAKQLKAEQLAAVAQAEAERQAAEVILTNADGKQYCRVHDCDNEATTEGHCRLHYLALWKRNKIKAKILQGGKLDKYIEDLTAKYPDKYLEMLRKDLMSEKDFNLIINEMDVEDSNDEAENEEDTSRFIEEVRGGIPTPDDDEGAF